MRLYLAGPMSGVPMANAPAFADVKAELESQGHSVVTPIEVNGRVWKDLTGGEFDPADAPGWEDPVVRTVFAEDVRVLLQQEGIALLDGWVSSQGARIELLIAKAAGMSILDQRGVPTEVEVNHHTSIDVPMMSVLEEAGMLVDRGPRQRDYGHPKDNYGAFADVINALLRQKLAKPVDEMDSVRLMVGLKLVRDANHSKRDNWTDVAGYARVGERVAAGLGLWPGVE